MLTPWKESYDKTNCCLVAKSYPTLCDPMDCSTPGLPVPHYLPEFAQVHVHWISDTVQPSHPLLLSSPSAFELTVHIRWPKYWNFSFSNSTSNKYSGLSDRFDLAVQGTLNSFLQQHSLKTSILQFSAFFMVQLSHLCAWLLEDHNLDYVDLCR